LNISAFYINDQETSVCNGMLGGGRMRYAPTVHTGGLLFLGPGDGYNDKGRVNIHELLACLVAGVCDTPLLCTQAGCCFLGRAMVATTKEG